MAPFSDTDIEFINSGMESIAISINSALAREKIQHLLSETQLQSEELQTQQEELRQMNEELEEQAQNLKQQQEELQITNEELEEQTQALEMKNKDVEMAKFDIEQKTMQLEVSSRYKSEFLANMSHELRTPLNSLLILSKDLADNKDQNLSAEQVESADIIYRSGNDLLHLINEVLDLAKVEAGKMILNLEKLPLKTLSDNLLRNFRRETEQKKLTFAATIADDLPDYIVTDVQRLDQILKNLISNAIKFTEKGSIIVAIRKNSSNTLAIEVSDTGIGIANEHQLSIFEAFQQADGGTSRKYGGTGLGLSISRELVKLLQGEIRLNSKENEGSTFTLILPFEVQETAAVEDNEVVAVRPPHRADSRFYNYPAIEDDRADIRPGDKVLLIIEDDNDFAAIVLKQARQKGFKPIVAATGEDGLLLAEQYKPHAIILDENLPGMNGLEVLTELKANPAVRHIPVHIISANERSLNAIKNGAIEYITKPVDRQLLEKAFGRIENFISRKLKNLLIVETDHALRETMCQLIGTGDVHCIEAESGQQAIASFRDNHIDCIVLDVNLPDISGFELINEFRKIKPGNVPPIIVYTDKVLTKAEHEELEKRAETIIIKGSKSEERLLDETALFLHKTISNLPVGDNKVSNQLYNKDAQFNQKRVLLVDDDMRNIFALSKILRDLGMEVTKADNGKTALAILESQPLPDLILMDIMMPEMDGYEAIKQIRMKREYSQLPVIALTAKAMKEDKQKCIDAGANDYITKPVDIQRLLSLMRVWLSK